MPNRENPRTTSSREVVGRKSGNDSAESLFFTNDSYTGKRLYFCRNCGHEIVKENNRWFHNGELGASLVCENTGEEDNLPECECHKPEPITLPVVSLAEHKKVVKEIEFRLGKRLSEVENQRNHWQKRLAQQHENNKVLRQLDEDMRVFYNAFHDADATWFEINGVKFISEVVVRKAIEEIEFYAGKKSAVKGLDKPYYYFYKGKLEALQDLNRCLLSTEGSSRRVASGKKEVIWNG